MDFRLPNLGEGIESATVTAVLVKPGDVVAVGKGLIAVETDKAAMEVEADQPGTIDAIVVKPGEKIAVGAVVLKLTVAGSSTTPKTEPKAEPKAAPAPTSPQPAPAPKSAAAPSTFKLPSLGEGIDAATVTNVLVKVGDSIKVGQAVISVETDKAAMEVEAESDGVIEKLLVKSGEKIAIGAPILSLVGATAAAEVSQPAEPSGNSKSTSTPVASVPLATAATLSREAAPANGIATKDREIIAAGPATRRLARELGVRLGELNGSGRGGRVTLDDVKLFIRSERQKTPKPGSSEVGMNVVVASAFTTPPLPDFSKFGEIERKPVANIRQTIAKNLTIAWRTIPMVTQNDLADITELEAGRKRVADSLPKGSPKITMTVLAIKACVAALREFPQFNSSYDMNVGELVMKKYYHIGIAVDTDRGLVVPVIRDADKKSIRDLAADVTALAEKARTAKLSIDEMRGGCFTLTNLGGIGELVSPRS